MNDSTTASRPDSTAKTGFDSAAVLRGRAEKDMALKGEESPIPEEIRNSFTGLRYFPIDPAMAFELRLERLPKPEPFKMAATKGDVRMMRRFGTFRFTVGGKACTLTAFTSEEHPQDLFIPFRDATSGDETYEVGRYIDLPVRDDDHYLLDFNMAYSPYCAYSSRYTCPVVPTENILPVAIKAGEMLTPMTGH